MHLMVPQPLRDLMSCLWEQKIINPGQTRMRVDKSWPVRVCSEINNCMRVDWILQHVARSLINFHQNLNQLNTDES